MNSAYGLIFLIAATLIFLLAMVCLVLLGVVLWLYSKVPADNKSLVEPKKLSITTFAVANTSPVSAGPVPILTKREIDLFDLLLGVLRNNLSQYGDQLTILAKVPVGHLVKGEGINYRTLSTRLVDLVICHREGMVPLIVFLFEDAWPESESKQLTDWLRPTGCYFVTDDKLDAWKKDPVALVINMEMDLHGTINKVPLRVD